MGKKSYFEGKEVSNTNEKKAKQSGVYDITITLCHLFCG